jgi:hypothetical protein
MASSDAGTKPVLVVMGLLFFAVAYANDRWAGILVDDPRKARWRRWPVAIVAGAIGAFFVVAGVITFF